MLVGNVGSSHSASGFNKIIEVIMFEMLSGIQGYLPFDAQHLTLYSIHK